MSTIPIHGLPDARLPGARMLVCLDGSHLAESCLPYAVSFAKTFGGAITLVQVLQPHNEHPGPQASDALGWEISRQEARAYLERVQAEVARDVGRLVETKLDQGHPAERIVGLARELDTQLVVLASHGQGGLTAWNLGSTVQQVLAVARASVFVARSSETPPALVIPRRILVPLDGSLRTESVLPTAARIASAYNAELLLVHVVRELGPTGVLHAPEDLALAHQLGERLEASAREYLARIRDRLLHDVHAVRTRVLRHADERQCLLEVAAHEATDLVVVSAHGAVCDPARAFGSVTEQLLAHATVPVLVLQDLPEAVVAQPQARDATLAPPPRSAFPPANV